MASIAQRNKNLVCDSTTFPLQPSFFNFYLLCQTMTCSTNSLDYPEVWDSLERLGTHKIFFQSANDCCKDHFKDESECAIVDRCSKANFAQVTMQQVNLKDTVKVQSNFLRDGVKMDRPEQLVVKCSSWHPAFDQPGACTNDPDLAAILPASMHRENHVDCCQDFFKTETCVKIDVCVAKIE